MIVGTNIHLFISQTSTTIKLANMERNLKGYKVIYFFTLLIRNGSPSKQNFLSLKESQIR
jgi:hypothetical protein